MISPKEFRLEIENHEIEHPQFVSIATELELVVRDALQGIPGDVEWVVGPSRIGKTALIERLLRLFPETHSNGSRLIPVLKVDVDPGVSPQTLPRAVLSALGHGNAKGNSAVLVNMMFSQLALAGTKVILFDECSHVVEEGQRLPRRQAADWFKTLMDRQLSSRVDGVHEEYRLTLFLFGVPLLGKLVNRNTNEQFYSRSKPPKIFMPYRFGKAKEYEEFGGFCLSFVEIFERNGVRINIDENLIVSNLYLLSAGITGIVVKFFRELGKLVCRTCSESANPTVDFELACLAARNVMHLGNPEHQAFEHENELPPALLLQAFSFNMDLYDWNHIEGVEL